MVKFIPVLCGGGDDGWGGGKIIFAYKSIDWRTFRGFFFIIIRYLKWEVNNVIVFPSDLWTPFYECPDGRYIQLVFLNEPD